MENSDSQTQFARIVKTSAFAFGAVVLAKLIGYAYKIVIARYFEAEIYGFFSLTLIVVGIVVSIASFGLFDGLTRQLSIYRSQGKNDLAGSLILTSKKFLICLGLIFCAISFFAAPYLADNFFKEPNLTDFIKIASFSIPIIILANLFLVVIRSYEKIRTNSILTNIVQHSAKLIALGFFILLGFDYFSVPLSYTLAALVLLICSWIFARSLYRTGNRKTDPKLLWGVIKYSWPLMFIGILTNVLYWTDSFVVGYFMNIRDVGVYSAAITLVSILGIVPELFIQLLYPIVAFNLARKNDSLVRSLVRRTAKWILCINGVIAVTFFFFAPIIVKVLFGSSFSQSVLPLQILIIGAIFTSLAAYFTNLLSVAAKTKKILMNFSIAAIINILLDLLVVPKYGLTGAAAATSISGFVLFVMTFYQVDKSYSSKPFSRKSALMLILIFILLCAGLFISSNINSLNYLVIGLLGLLTYLFAVIFLKIVDSEDKKLVKDMFSRADYSSKFEG